MTQVGADWEVEQLGRNVHRITFDFRSREDVGWVLLRSDAHHDNPHSNNKLEEKHLQQAVERNAAICDNGDAFCAMQGRWDKRSDKSALKPEHQVDNYLDSLVSTYADFLAPYASHIAVLGTGNHETSILKHHETNLTSRLTERLRTIKTNGPIYEGTYTGWCFMSAVRRQKKGGKKWKKSYSQTEGRLTKRLWRTHGYGGAAPVTKGVIQTNRRAVYVPDADIILSGHTHQEWYFPIQRVRVTNQGTVYQDTQWHVSLPSYKDSYGDGASYGEWAIEKGMPPAPVGAAWLKFHVQADKKKDFLLFDIERAN